MSAEHTEQAPQRTIDFPFMKQTTHMILSDGVLMVVNGRGIKPAHELHIDEQITLLCNYVDAASAAAAKKRERREAIQARRQSMHLVK